MPAATPARTLARPLLAEFLGTAFLLAAVVGSGIMAENLSTDVGLQLLQNAFATAGVLTALILTFGGASGAHFNPAVTLSERLLGSLDSATATAYVAAQVAGGAAGVMAANIMFELDAVNVSAKDRSGLGLVVAEFVATLGLLLVIHGVVRSGRAAHVAYAVGGYIAGAYYFTSSTSFANPAVALARTLSDTFAGIEPASVPGFVAAQLVAVLVTVPLVRLLYPDPPPTGEAGDGAAEGATAEA